MGKRSGLPKRPLTVERLRELLHYDPHTGVFTWRAKTSRASRVRIGMVAGSVLPSGGRIIEIEEKAHQAHRIAWLYMNGVWPAGDLDHRDCNKDNNAIGNLRLADDTHNAANKRLSKRSGTGFKGVSAIRYGRFTARIMKHGVAYALGSFATAEEAHAAYFAKAVELYGEFARAA